jgi:hypothetical protein
MYGNLSSFVDWRAFTHDKTFEGRFTIIPSPPKNSIQNPSHLTMTCDTCTTASNKFLLSVEWCVTNVTTVSVSHHHANRLNYKALTIIGTHMLCSLKRWQKMFVLYNGWRGGDDEDYYYDYDNNNNNNKLI